MGPTRTVETSHRSEEDRDGWIDRDDGTEGDATAGTAYVIEPGHEAWVVGDEPAVAFEFDSSTAETFASPL
jgi:hypothetical protein